MVSFLKLNSSLGIKKSESDLDKTKIFSINKFHRRDYNNLKPLLILITSQEKKKYLEWTNLHMYYKTGKQPPIPVSKILIIGTNLHISLLPNSKNDNDNILINICSTEYVSLEIQENQLKFSSGIYLTGDDYSRLVQLVNTIKLVQFERLSLFKCLTASVISNVGIQMLDIHLILNSTYSFKDWCYIYIGDEWVKSWVHIDKISKNKDLTTKCQVKFFYDNKSSTKKNLICYITDCSAIDDLFFTMDHSLKLPDINTNSFQDLLNKGLNNEDALNAYLTNLTTLQFIGGVRWPKKKRDTSRSRSSSLSWISKSSKNQPLSDAVIEPSIDTDLQQINDDCSTISSKISNNKHKRNTSFASNTSMIFHPSTNDDFTITNGLFIKPIPHTGIHHLESMIRFIIPMMNCLKLYGRPKEFKTERGDLLSLSFGLPKLPVVDFFAKEELQLINEHVENTNTELTLNELKSFLKKFMDDKNVDRSTLSFNTLNSYKK